MTDKAYRFNDDIWPGDVLKRDDGAKCTVIRMCQSDEYLAMHKNPPQTWADAYEVRYPDGTIDRILVDLSTGWKKVLNP